MAEAEAHARGVLCGASGPMGAGTHGSRDWPASGVAGGAASEEQRRPLSLSQIVRLRLRFRNNRDQASGRSAASSSSGDARGLGLRARGRGGGAECVLT